MTVRYRRFGSICALLVFAFAGQAACRDETKAKSYVDAFFRMWAFEQFWNPTNRDSHHQPQAKALLSVYWNSRAAGLCSFDLSYCESYEIIQGNLGQQQASEDIARAGNLQRRTEAFITKHKPYSTNWDDGEVQICEIETVLPALDLRSYWRREGEPADLSAVIGMLKSLGLPADATNYTPPKRLFVIPYYETVDPVLFVLDRGEGGKDTVLLFAHDAITGAWRIGGHYDEDEGRDGLILYRDIILRNQLTSFRVP